MILLKRVLWYLIAGSRGGVNRARIIETLHQRPYNVNQLSQKLDLDYKTIQHHIKVLEDHNIVNSTSKKKYGAMIFLSNRMEDNYNIYLEIISKMKKNR